MRANVVAQNISSSRSTREYQADNIRYMIASTPSMISQYYELLENIYQSKFDKSFCVSAHEHYTNTTFGQIVVALNNKNIVVGGARIIFSMPNNRCKLPLESPSIVLNKLLPELQLNKKIYAEWGRFIKDPSVPKEANFVENLSMIMMSIAKKFGCEYLFSMPNIFMRLRFEKIFHDMGLEFKEVVSPDDMPRHITFPTVPVYVTVTSLESFHVSLASSLRNDQQLYDCCV